MDSNMLYELAHVIATHPSARLSVINDELVLMPDSDADGLDDWEEQYETGTNPLVADTDGDGCRDGLEVRKGFWPLSGIEPCPPDSLGDEFLKFLAVAAIYFFEDDSLYMDLRMDSGTMQFAPGLTVSPR